MSPLELRRTEQTYYKDDTFKNEYMAIIHTMKRSGNVRVEVLHYGNEKYQVFASTRLGGQSHKVTQSAALEWASRKINERMKVKS